METEQEVDRDCYKMQRGLEKRAWTGSLKMFCELMQVVQTFEPDIGWR